MEPKFCYHLLLLALLFGCAALPATAQSTVSSKILERATQDKNKDFHEFPDLLAIYLNLDLDSITQEILQEGPDTQVQQGAAAETSGTTTLTEKPGIAELLNLAIESGAIVKTTSGTSFTLQTTPYLLYSRFGARDTAETWDSLTQLRKIAISATFSQGANGSTDVGQNNFERGEVKYNWGERSPRDRDFRQRVRQVLNDKIHLDTATQATTANLSDFRNGLTPVTGLAWDTALANFSNWWSDQPKPIRPKDLLTKLNQELEPVRAGLRDQDREALDRLVKSLGVEQKTFDDASKLLSDETKKYLDEPHSQFSLAGAYQRDLMIVDFVDVKGIFGYKTSKAFSFDFNGEVMVNTSRTAVDGTKLDSLRAYSFAADLTIGKFAKDTGDFTLAAKLIRPQGESRNMASVQAKLNLYWIRGFTIPISLSYSNRTEDSDHSRVRLNVGLSMNADSFMGAARTQP